MLSYNKVLAILIPNIALGWYGMVVDEIEGNKNSFNQTKPKILYIQDIVDIQSQNFFLGGNGQVPSEPTTTSSYFLHKQCTGGSKITGVEECKSACTELGIELTNPKNFKDNKPCFKGGNRKCSQNGRNGKNAILVCTDKGNLMQHNIA